MTGHPTVCADCRTFARTDVPGHEHPHTARPQSPAQTTPQSTPLCVGGVTVTDPNTKGYYRLKWREPDGALGDTSGSRDLHVALGKAEDIDPRLSLAAGPQATQCLEDLLTEFIAHGHSPFKDKKPYKQAQLDGLRHKLTCGLRGQEHVRAMDLDRTVCTTIRQQAGTHNGVTEVTSALRAFLRWGQQKGYFTAEQVELLPRAASTPEPARHLVRTPFDDGGPADRARMVGQDEDYVDDEDCPNADQLISLRTALQKHFPLWGALACEFAANTGARWGEQFQLAAPDVHLDGCRH